jgi:gluconolactonase
MSAVTLARPVRIVETDAHEGPVYVRAEHALYFTTQRPRVDVKRIDLRTLEVTLVRANANVANGMAPFGDGRLLVCEQHPAAVTLLDPATGATEVLADSWNGLRLNSPNDIVRRRDGSVWFTDPSYGFLQGFRPRARGRRPRLPLRPGHWGARGRRRLVRQAERDRVLARRVHPLRR